MSVIELAQALIRCPSVTPDDAGCQAILADRLRALGFDIQRLMFGQTSNLWARKGKEGPLLILAGHTDVVPPGELTRWHFPPFEAVIKNQTLYGRGAQDMKSSLAAMVIAVERYLKEPSHFSGSIAFLITSDEEGDGLDGTPKVVEYLHTQNVHMDYVVVGEATCQKQLGDTIKVGRRGSLHAQITFKGTGGHVAYPTHAINPIHAALSGLQALCQTEWDQGNEYFPPTTFQISNIHAGTGAPNVIPTELKVTANFRFSPESSVEKIKNNVMALLDHAGCEYTIEWQVGAEAYYSPPGKLALSVQKALQECCHLTPHFNTEGGTSDGRWLSHYCSEVIEFGPVNDTIHKPNENIPLRDLEKLVECYEVILKEVLGKNKK